MDVYKKVGLKIKAAREDRGLLQDDLAEKLGYSRTTISMYESGRTRIAIEELIKVAKFLGKPISYFIDEETEKELQQRKVSALEDIKASLKRIEEEEKQAEQRIEKAEKEFDVTKIPGYIPLDKFKLIPIVGRIHAGELHEATQHAEEMLPIPADADADYALRVYGDSMEPYYNEGDLVVVKETPEAYNGAHVVASVDNLTGFSEAIEAAFPRAEIQKCIVHQVRNSIRYVSYKDVKKLTADMKKIYTAPSEATALEDLDRFEQEWGKKYPLAVRSWRNNWSELATFFKYPPEIRKIIYTTNIIESYHRQLRKVTKGKAIFPSDDALSKMLYLVTQDVIRKWTGRIANWGQLLSQFNVFFSDRLEGYLD